MALFPLFMDISGKKCVVVGGGKVAARKIQTLVKFDPCIKVVSPVISEEILQLERENKLAAIRKEYSEEDLEGAFIAIAATDSPNVNMEVHHDAVSRGIPVNVADCPGICSFVFPSIVRRGELVIGISTSSVYPAMSKMIRKRIEDTFPEYYEGMLELLKEYRLKAELKLWDDRKRERFLNRMLEEVLKCREANHLPGLKNDMERIFEEYRNEKDY